MQEVVDPRYDPRNTPRSVRERSKSAPSFSPKNKKKSNGLFKKNKKEESPTMNGSKVTGPSLLWHKDTVELYLRILQESADPGKCLAVLRKCKLFFIEILEASAAAIQNLAACQFEGSIQVRTDVRALKGLPILVELLKLRDDKVVCSVVNALRNLCIDSVAYFNSLVKSLCFRRTLIWSAGTQCPVWSQNYQLQINKQETHTFPTQQLAAFLGFSGRWFVRVQS